MPTLEDIAKAKDAKGHGSDKRHPGANYESNPFSRTTLGAAGTNPGYTWKSSQHKPSDPVHYVSTHSCGYTSPKRASSSAAERDLVFHGDECSHGSKKRVSKLADLILGPARTLDALMKRKDAKGHGSDKKDEKPGSKSPFAIADVPGHDAFVATRPGGTHHQISHSYGDDIIDMHHEGGNAYREGKYGTPFPANDHLDAAKKVLDRRKVEYDRGEQERNRREHERKHGNEYTGDITGLHQHMHVHRVIDNHVEGSTPDGNHKVHLNVYNEGSKFGIGGGRVSKLEMREPYGNTVVNYDRGWDVRPKTPEHKEFVRNVTRTLGGKLTKSVDGDELWADAEEPSLMDRGPLQKRADAPAEGGAGA